MSLSPHARKFEIVLDSGFDAMDYGLEVVDSGFFVMGTGIPDSKKKFPAFRIPRAKISLIPESGLPYM